MAKIGGAVVARVGIIRNFGCVGFGVEFIYRLPHGGGGPFQPPLL